MAMKTGESYLCSREKRLFDLSTAAVVSPVMSALALGVMPVLAAENGGALFQQRRVGDATNCREGLEPYLRPLVVPDMIILKLKTLPDRPGRIAIDCGYKHPEEMPFSALVRQLRIDEAPQLLAVWKGEMSTVGPRPYAVETVERIMDELSPREQREWLEARRVAKPGLAYLGVEQQYDPGFVPDLRSAAYNDIAYAAMDSLKLGFRIIAGVASALIASIMLRDTRQEFT